MKKMLSVFWALAIFAGLSATVLGQKPFNGEVTITDFDNSGNRTSITSDFNGVKYRDYRLPNGDPCVAANGATAFLMYPQRSDCSVPSTRNFYIYFPAAATSDPDFPAACKSNFDATRSQYYVSAWRMYFKDLFSNPKKNAILKTEVLFGFYCGTAAYSVQTDQTIAPNISGNFRRLLNTGPNAITSSLYYPSGGDFYPVGVNGFEFTFDVTVQKF